MNGTRTQKDSSSGSAKATIYLLRHGEITGTKGPIRYIGQTDSLLSPVGRDQAQWWSQKLSDVFFEAIYACDLKRSKETAAILAASRQIPVLVRPGLREIDLGQWEKRTIASVRRSFPDEFHRRGQDFANYRPPGGESFTDLRDRVVPTFESIVRETQENVLIVGHAGVNRMILCHVLGLQVGHLFRVAQDYGCLNVIEMRENLFRVTTLNARPGKF